MIQIEIVEKIVKSWKYTDKYPCPKCGIKLCTPFYTCVKCNIKFKVRINL